MKVLVLREPEIRGLIGPGGALKAVRDAFVRLARGEATLPGVINLDIPSAQGEVHVKGAWLHGTPFFSIRRTMASRSFAKRASWAGTARAAGAAPASRKTTRMAVRST